MPAVILSILRALIPGLAAWIEAKLGAKPAPATPVDPSPVTEAHDLGAAQAALTQETTDATAASKAAAAASKVELTDSRVIAAQPVGVRVDPDQAGSAAIIPNDGFRRD